MRTQKTSVSSLKEYNDVLMELHDTPSGKYDVHLGPREYYKYLLPYIKPCDSVAEFGIMQGHFLAFVMLNGIKKVRGYDISTEWFDQESKLFYDYAKVNNIDLNIVVGDTSTCDPIDTVDMLHIDSLHQYNHCSKELKRHAIKVNKFIAFHDVNTVGVWKAISEFLSSNSDWELTTRNTDGVGFAVIQKSND